MTCYIAVLKINVLQNITLEFVNWPLSCCFWIFKLLALLVFFIVLLAALLNCATAIQLFPRWRPSMKPLIAPPVLFDETIDRGGGPAPSSLLLHISFELCRSWLRKLLLLHVSRATVVHLEHSSWASYGKDSQEETPSQNVPELRGSMSLHQAYWDFTHWGGSWLNLVLLWVRFAPFLSSTRLNSQRLWRSCASRCQKARWLRLSRLVSNLA